MCLSFLTICYLSVRSPMSCTVKLLSYLNLFAFRRGVQRGQLTLPGIAGDFTSLMMIPHVVVCLGLVYCHPTLALLNKTVCCGIFDWATQTLHICNIYFPTFFLNLMSLLYLVMCVSGQNNIESLFPHNHINLHNRLTSSIVTFGVLPRSPPPQESGGL